MSIKTSINCTVAGLSLLFSVWAQAANLYRYTNAEGVTVVDYQVPAEYVRNGYEILNADGMVVRVVPRELSPEEKNMLYTQDCRFACSCLLRIKTSFQGVRPPSAPQ